MAFIKRFTLILKLIILSWVGGAFAAGGASAPQGGFSFIQITDTHLEPAARPSADISKLRSVAALRTLGETIRASRGPARPSFILHTGDLTEFGFAGQTTSFVEGILNGLGLPVYWTPGNHDMTWSGDLGFARRQGGVNFTFRQGGVTFVGLRTATPQDYAPSFGPEMLDFVARALKPLSPADPVILAMHHPPNTEFASRHDYDRLLDLLRPYNVVVMLVGHGHRAYAWQEDGLDWVMGGSTFSPKGDLDGYNLVTVTSATLNSTYHTLTIKKAPRVMLAKALAPGKPYPVIQIEAPAAEAVVREGGLAVRARIAGDVKLTSAAAVIDDTTRVALALHGGAAEGTANLEALNDGAHSLRVEFIAGPKIVYHRSTEFVLARAGAGRGCVLWRTRLASGFKATPLLVGERLYLGGLDGKLRALDCGDGRIRWSFDAGSEILGTAAAAPGGKIVFGTGGGDLIVLDAEGREAGRHHAGGAVDGAPVVDAAGIAYAGDNQGELLALDTRTGKLVWQKKIAAQAIESGVALADGRLYAGSWDGYVYCAQAATGEQVWRAPGPYCQKTVNRYYAPADDGPKVAGGRLWVADRAYRLGRYGLDGKYEGDQGRGVAAVGVAEDAQSIYARHLTAGLEKLGLDGKALWTSADGVRGRVPTPPQERAGRVYGIGNTGLLSVLDSKDGRLLWRYQLTPGLFVFGGVAVGDKGEVYAAGMDGCVSAIAPTEGK